MKFYIIIEEKGSWSQQEWKIQKVVCDDKDYAYRIAWLMAFNNWSNDYIVEEWMSAEPEALKMKTVGLSSSTLRKKLSTKTADDLKSDLEGGLLPEILENYLWNRDF